MSYKTQPMDIKAFDLFVPSIYTDYIYRLMYSLTDDQNEESKMKMKAKINFYVKKVGHHKNVLDFIGSVEDDVRMY